MKLIFENWRKQINEIRPGNTGIGEDGRFLLIDSSISDRIAGAS